MNRFVKITITTASYFLAARWGSSLDGGTDGVAPLWPAAGVGLAALLLGGWRAWPGVLLGALLFNFADHQPPILAFALSVGACLEAVLPAWLMSRFAGFTPALSRFRDVLALTGAAGTAVALAATISMGGLFVTGSVKLDDVAAGWFNWWIGDCLGALVAGGLILTWSQSKPRRWNFRHTLEAIAILLLTVAGLQFAFFFHNENYMWMPYGLFPIALWAAIRFGTRGSTAVTAIICTLTTWATLGGNGPFLGGFLTQDFLALQMFIGLVGMTSLLVGAGAEDRRRTELTLRESEANMAAAQRIGHFGSWELELLHPNLADNPIRWSEECFRVFGFEPQTAPITNEFFFRRIPPADHAAITRAMTEAIRDHKEYSLVHRLTLPDGDTRYIHERARVVLDEETGQPTKMLGTAHDITDQHRAESQLRDSEERYRLLADNATDMISRHNPLGVFLYVSPACRHLLGYEPEELIGRQITAFLHVEDANPLRAAQPGGNEPPESLTASYRLRRQDSKYVWVETTARCLRELETGRVTEIVSITRDITERRSLESQLLQSQKMEAIGQLAGGIAHDFNNMLTVVSGYVSLILAELPAGHRARDSVMEIHKAAERATALTRQLLAFGRRSILDPKVVDLNALILDSEKMIRRIIGEDIELTTVFVANPWRVKVDRTQMDQVILNIVVNARDAMPQGGKLTIETDNVELDEHYTRTQPEARPGPHVMLAITDSGAGMDAETIEHIFEPFYTTKDKSKGTGLGLATVYGIIKQSGGHISVYSELGLGSVFKIYLPSVSETATPVKSASPDLKKVVPGRGTILLVEDEEVVRLFAEQVLFNAGYQVLTAANGAEAVELANRFLKDINLLLTDVVMPQMSGRQVAEALKAKRPNLKVLYMSGYTDDAVLRHGVLTAESAFLPKPFSPVALTEKVSAVIRGTV